MSLRSLLFLTSFSLWLTSCTIPSSDEAVTSEPATTSQEQPSKLLITTLESDLLGSLQNAGFGVQAPEIVAKGRLLADQATTMEDAANALFMKGSVGALAIYDSTTALSLKNTGEGDKENALGLITKVIFTGVGKHNKSKTDTEMLALAESLIASSTEALKTANIIDDKVASAIKISANFSVASLDEYGFSPTRGFDTKDITRGLASISNGVIANAGFLKIDNAGLSAVFGALSQGAVAAISETGASAEQAASMAGEFANSAIKQIEVTAVGKTFFAQMASSITGGTIASLALAGVPKDKLLSALNTMMEKVSQTLAELPSAKDIRGSVLGLMSQTALSGLSEAGIDRDKLTEAASVINQSINPSSQVCKLLV